MGSCLYCASHLIGCLDGGRASADRALPSRPTRPPLRLKEPFVQTPPSLAQAPALASTEPARRQGDRPMLPRGHRRGIRKDRCARIVCELAPVTRDEAWQLLEEH